MNAIVFERVKHYYSGIPGDNVHILSEKDFVDCVYPNPDTLSYEPCYERHYFVDGEDKGVSEEAQIRFANWRDMTVTLTPENIDEYIAKVREELRGDVHDIAGDPSSAAERFDVNAYNAKVDRMRGDEHKMDSRSGVVLTEADTSWVGIEI